MFCCWLQGGSKVKVLQVWGEPRLLFSSMSGFFLFIFSLDLSLDLSLFSFSFSFLFL